MPEINLLPEEERKQVAVKVLRGRITIYSVAALIVGVLISVIVFGYWLVLLRTENQISAKIQNLSTQIQNLSNVETLARVLKSKLSNIVTISAKSQNFENLLTDVSQLIPAGVTLSDLTVSEKNLVTLTGIAVSAPEFSNLVTSLLQQNTAKVNFSDVTVETLTRDDKGIYKFAISAKLKKAL